MSREYIYGDISNHATDVRDEARRLLHALEAEDRGTEIDLATVRESINRIAKFSGHLQADLSSLNFRIEAEREEAELRRNPLPHTLPLPLEGGAS